MFVCGATIGEAINRESDYRVAMPASMANGLEDSPFGTCRRLIDREQGVLPSMLLRNWFSKQRIAMQLLMESQHLSGTAQRAISRFLHGARDQVLHDHHVLPRFTPALEGRLLQRAE